MESKIRGVSKSVGKGLNRSGRGIRRVQFAAVAAIACVLGMAGTSWAATNELFHKIVPLNSGGSFLLENVNGSVQVEGWDRNEVEVSAVKSSDTDPGELGQVKIEVDSVPGKVAVRTRYPNGQGADVAVEYRVHVPYKVLLGSVETVNGSVLVRGVEGSGDLKSVNGNVEVLNSSGRFNAKTTNGDLHLELRQLLDGSPMDIETVNGSVVLGLPSNGHANVKVLSMNGDLTSDLPLTSTGGNLAAHNFRAQLGTGGGNISVRTVNGGIHLLLQRPGV
ncbi:MAG TPA: DUF4097 family beta strand repeat-containing protein [Verrucomicrobiae bacterium]|nr:DUF4097 family beta strand repeat-containing protein [Verrucomicrobiae bacterium]